MTRRVNASPSGIVTRKHLEWNVPRCSRADGAVEVKREEEEEGTALRCFFAPGSSGGATSARPRSRRRSVGLVRWVVTLVWTETSSARIAMTRCTCTLC